MCLPSYSSAPSKASVTTGSPALSSKINTVLKALVKRQRQPVTLEQLGDDIFNQTNSKMNLSDQTIAREIRRLRSRGWIIRMAYKGLDDFGVRQFEYTFA